ncbi:hypothetical protein I545_2825 [Mycobacterium kansasii 662]|uniref:Uncharacterized protein n=3 Tax=Mycobacterium kansasii TaxID=1768 RepID=A0A1V3WLS2_MYCKA|nr:hypothetical protein MKAN_03200 [Mycobacterium kansasii ATCC 12478]EUA18715.1 hypothetical protein I545_2825 [Mycobacterium kansasii 662]KEP41248.1 hypothetical protein MKSMC1_36690 [Mycobacterium kansasii]OOK67933.1 hypothetical protein BZL29_6753 [Mycobacterium kansasii]
MDDKLEFLLTEDRPDLGLGGHGAYVDVHRDRDPRGLPALRAAG